MTRRPPPSSEVRTHPTRLETRPGPSATLGRPVPGATAVNPDTGEVNDIIEPGDLTRALRRRTPRLVAAHDWAPSRAGSWR
ncbi:hypothetical protein ACFO4M_09160 [Pseudonocardia nematodicida]|uniref:hypothetical protein n=1 Tax=Pseudonocardia nematodicida TaxID=1206997 RepID=UPI00361690B8